MDAATAIPGKVATWLELAVAPDWRRQQCRIRVHMVGPREGACYAISMDGRWLCAGSGELTVFRGLSAALHFLKLLRIEDFEPGEPAGMPAVGTGRHYCMCADKKKGLLPCDCNSRRCATTH
ncbi:hypothetical protein [Azoarcus sp. DN11]|uniref:hypothetical protein n=1 Tax=Azoarcus sp. DN11 TaxID=356837 RepID=UPI000EAF95B3|nr:hypothetical protein [Azoarcus sp. DN11]AYH43198.1 hypothetical protein CDA09_07325 [Azoarcus sp. DN11]